MHGRLSVRGYAAQAALKTLVTQSRLSPTGGDSCARQSTSLGDYVSEVDDLSSFLSGLQLLHWPMHVAARDTRLTVVSRAVKQRVPAGQDEASLLYDNNLSRSR